MNPWDLIKRGLENRLSGEAYRTWVQRTGLRSLDGDTLTVGVPDEATKFCMEVDYPDHVTTVAKDLGIAAKKFVYEVAPEPRPQPATATSVAPESAAVREQRQPELQDLFGSPTAHINVRFNFDGFVVGPCNQFAHAAAKAVATMPGKSYNPLFIYGGVGMGKTHLMHAIGHSLIQNHSQMRIVYTTSEKFVNSMINSIKLDRLSQFHQYFRSADVLLVDDIQFIGGKERTQEEFFYAFNELYDHQKQIVISSDSPPKSTPGLVERLRSRFEWGLMVDVQPPDLETKMAILDKKAEQDNIRLPEDVRIFIATKTKSNVRELEGALVKLMAYSSVSGSPITLAMAQQVLRHLTHGQERRVTIESVVKAVAERYNLTPAQLKAKSNTKDIAYPRQIAMYVAREVTHASLPEIGKHFNGKHHTTVLHSIQKIEQLRHADVDLNRLIHSVMDSLH